METSGCWAARQPPVSACVSSFGEFGFSSAQALQKAFPVQISAPRPRGLPPSPAQPEASAHSPRLLRARNVTSTAPLSGSKSRTTKQNGRVLPRKPNTYFPHRRLDRKNFGGTPRSRTRFATVLRAAIRSVRQGATAPRADCDFHVSQWSRSYPSHPRGRMLSNTVESRICYGNNDRYGNNVRISQPQPGRVCPTPGNPAPGHPAPEEPAARGRPPFQRAPSTSTTQMSQQAKIAAALSRAGLQTDIWTRAEVQAPSLSPISVTEKIQMDSRTAPSSTTPPNDATPEPSLLAECSSPSRFVIAKGSDDSRFLISNHNHPPNPRVDWKSALLVVADWGETWGLDLGARPNICLQTGPAQGGGDLGLLGHLRGRGREGSAGKADDLGRRGLLALDVPVLGFPELGRRGPGWGWLIRTLFP